MSSDFSNALRRFSNDLETKVSRIAAKKRVSFAELFTPAFMQRHTQVASFEALLEQGGFHVESEDDFRAIPGDEWEKLVTTHTSFPSWLEMQKVAGNEWVKRELSV